MFDKYKRLQVKLDPEQIKTKEQKHHTANKRSVSEANNRTVPSPQYHKTNNKLDTNKDPNLKTNKYL